MWADFISSYTCCLDLSQSVPVHQVGVHYELSEEEKYYRNALTRMPDGPAALEEAYNAVEDIVNEVEQYVKVKHLSSHILLPILSLCSRSRFKTS